MVDHEQVGGIEIDGRSGLIRVKRTVAFVSFERGGADTIENDAAHPRVVDQFYTAIIAKADILGQSKVDDYVVECNERDGIVCKLRLTTRKQDEATKERYDYKPEFQYSCRLDLLFLR